jgi:hypothetical protein
MSWTQERREDPLPHRRPIFQLVGPAVLALAAVLAAAGYLWHSHIPVTYEIDSNQILLVHPEKTDNSYAYFPRATIMTAWVVSQKVAQADIRQEVVQQGGLSTYQATVPNNGDQWVPIYNYPTIQFTIQTTDAAAGLRTAALVAKFEAQQLNAIQEAEGAPPSSRITLRTLGPATAEALPSRPSRALLAIGILSLWISVIVVRFVRLQVLWRLRFRRAPRVDLLPRPSVSAQDREEDLVRS